MTRKADIIFPFVTSKRLPGVRHSWGFVWPDKEKGHQVSKKELLAVIMRDAGEREKN